VSFRLFNVYPHTSTKQPNLKIRGLVASLILFGWSTGGSGFNALSVTTAFVLPTSPAGPILGARILSPNISLGRVALPVRPWGSFDGIRGC